MMARKLIIFAAFLFTLSCAQQRIFRSRKGLIELSNDTLVISCKRPSLITDVFSPLNKTIAIERVAISLCKLPENPIVETFQHLNINATNINTLAFSFVDFENVGENFTRGLRIQNLELKTKHKLFNSSHNFFNSLSNLINLTISGAELPSLPPSLEIIGIYSDASIKTWEGCENLKEMTIRRVQNYKQIPEEWPESCSKLNRIKLTEMSEDAVEIMMKTVVARSPNLQALSIQFCKLYELPFKELHSNIVYLDLRSNHITELTREETSQMFGTSARKIWLAGNPIDCRCANGRMLEALHMNQSQVVDYDELTCAEGRYRLRSVSVPEICRFVVMSNLEYGMGYVWGLCCSISVFSVVLLVVTRRYGHLVRTILYSRGYCIWCFGGDIDSERVYDAFLSFAHGDDQFVLEELLPRLEATPNEFRVCIHYRDWAVGEWIPAQIMQSVRMSKRTIIVLSKNFVKSWWGVLEFRYAHASAMAEGRSRLLVLILDDVLNEKLQPELQGYLEYHTFLRCNDPFFWDKLRFAMPHRDNTIE